jgi:Uma2 family endonuclease
MPATALLTSEQYLALPDEFDKNGNRVKDELIGGEVVRMPPASRVHDQLAIEVVSPQVKEKHFKRKVDSYLQGGSNTVWVVYPDTRSVMVHTSDSVRELKANQKIDDPLLPRFSTPVSAFFELT